MKIFEKIASSTYVVDCYPVDILCGAIIVFGIVWFLFRCYSKSKRKQISDSYADIIEITVDAFTYINAQRFDRVSDQNKAFKDFCHYMKDAAGQILPSIDTYMELMRHEKDHSKIHWVSKVKNFFGDFSTDSCLGGMPDDLERRKVQSTTRLRSNIEILSQLINSNDDALNFD